MSFEHSQDPSSTDPSLRTGNTQRPIDRDIRQLAADPDSLSGAERDTAITEAKRISGGNTIIVEDDQGELRWGKEHPTAFTFDGNIRSEYDRVSADPAKRTDAQSITAMGGEGALRGKNSHVIFELEDGQKILIRRTNEKASADLQTFDLLATSQQEGRTAQDMVRTDLDTSMLKDIVVVPGERLVLGRDPETGKRIQTRSKVASITSFGMTDDRIVHADHPKRDKPELRRDTIKEFGETLRSARRGKVAPALGRAANRLSVSASTEGEAAPSVAPMEEVTSPESETPNTPDIDQYLENSGIDLQAASDAFEAQAKDYLRTLHATARIEGRDLTDNEKQLASNIVELVRSQRKVN